MCMCINNMNTYVRYIDKALSYFLSCEYKTAKASNNNKLSELSLSLTSRCSNIAETTAEVLYKSGFHSQISCKNPCYILNYLEQCNILEYNLQYLRLQF